MTNAELENIEHRWGRLEKTSKYSQYHNDIHHLLTEVKRLLEYVALLTSEVDNLMGLAVVHGYNGPGPERIAHGKRLRKELGISDDISWAKLLLKESGKA